MKHMAMNLRTLWSNIEARLDSRRPNWRTCIDEMGQLAAVEERSAGRTWDDDEVFEAILLAVLSSNTVWSRVERVKADLAKLFFDFSLEAYANLSITEIDNRFVPWFKDRKVGSVSLRGGLANLICAARILLQYSKCHGTADGYFTSLVHQCAGDPKQAALRLGGQSEYKLPSLGVALAAEALKNLGFDVAKPDRHIMRAVGAFGLVDFSPWKCAQDGTDARKAPNPTPKRHWLAMNALEEIAAAAKQRVALVDNAIWLLCERSGKASGLYLTNPQLAQMARRNESSEYRPQDT